MATYPLKNIAIGGNTYQINGSDKYHCLIMGPSVSDLIDIYQFNNTNISTSYLDVVKNFTVVSNPGETLLDMINNDEQCVHLNYGAYPTSNLYLKSVEFTGASSDPIDFYFESEVYEDNGTAYVSQVIVRVSGASPFSIISITGKKIACGGGGGGSSVVPLHLLKNGSLVALTSITSADTLTLVDDNNNALTISDVETHLQAGDILRIDQVSGASPRTYTNITDVDVVNNKISLMFINGNNIWILILYNGWSNNWQVQLLQKIMTN